MFVGMFRKKPDKAEALKQVAVIRVTPYLLHYFQEEELKLDL